MAVLLWQLQRFKRLPVCSRRFWRISQPPGVVFDESHFGKFTQHYQRGTYVFDIHPPLGKITFAYLGFLIGYDNHLCQYDNINDQYGPNCEYWKLRCISAFFGSLVRCFPLALSRVAGGHSPLVFWVTAVLISFPRSRFASQKSWEAVISARSSPHVSSPLTC
jgi:dolichyl-phosphate-mannose-protein mannosyltransferase